MVCSWVNSCPAHVGMNLGWRVWSGSRIEPAPGRAVSLDPEAVFPSPWLAFRGGASIAICSGRQGTSVGRRPCGGGRIAVVTGGNQGLGLEICRQLANEVLVVLTARDEKKGINAVAKLHYSGYPDVVFHQLDVTDPTSIASLAFFIELRFRKLDILVNNAGMISSNADEEYFEGVSRLLKEYGLKGYENEKPSKKVETQTFEEAKQCLETNYYGAKYVTQALMPLLRKSTYPRIVNISSKMGQLQHVQDENARKILSDVDGLTEEMVDEVVSEYLKDAKDQKLLEKKGWSINVSGYIVSKAALNAYTRILAKKFPSFCANAVTPGFLATSFTSFKGTYTVEEGAMGPVRLALLPEGGPSVVVVLTARDKNKGTDAVAKLHSSGLLDVVFHQLDVTNPASIASLVNFVGARFGKLDILVNNAGVSGTIFDEESIWSLNLSSDAIDENTRESKKFATQTFEGAQNCLETNYYGAKHVTQSLLALLLKSTSPRIVNISSKLGQLHNVQGENAKRILGDFDGLTEEVVDEVVSEYLKDAKDEELLKKKGWSSNVSGYVVSKAALNAYTRILARKFPSISANAVSPGFVATEMSCFKGTSTVEEGARGPWTDHLRTVICVRTVRTILSHTSAIKVKFTRWHFRKYEEYWKLPTRWHYCNIRTSLRANFAILANFANFWRTSLILLANFANFWRTSLIFGELRSETYSFLLSFNTITNKYSTGEQKSEFKKMASKRIAVITGGNKGVGLEICRQIANEILVVLTARDEQRGVDAVAKLHSSGLQDVVFHQLDVTDPASITSFANFIDDRFGKLDILVNNAGIASTIVDEESFWSIDLPSEVLDKKAKQSKKVLTQTFEGAKKCLETNYYGAKHVTQALIPLLLKSTSPKIVNVSSKLGQLENVQDENARKILSDIDGLTEEVVDEVVSEYLEDVKDEKLMEKKGWTSNVSGYIVSKAALNAYTRIVAKEFPSICANAVSPGFVATDMTHFKGTSTVEEGARGPMDNWSSDESDFTEQIAMMAMMGMQQVVQILRDEEEEEGVVNSQPNTRQRIPRDRVGAHNRLVEHYFAPNCVYPPSVFRRHFRMRKPLFLRILNDVTANSQFMQQRSDATGSQGFSELQKCAIAIRQLAYGSVSDSWDEYFQMSERIALESLDEFCSCIISLYWGKSKAMEKTNVKSTQKRVAVVTGGNKGIGLEICRQLALSGVTVVLTARNEDRGIEAIKKLKVSGFDGDVVFHQLDVKDPTSVARLAKFVETQFKKLDILVNNAAESGIIVKYDEFRAFKDGAGYEQVYDENAHLLTGILEQPYDLGEKCVKTNFYGTKGVTEAFLPLLHLSDSPRIVNISSNYGELHENKLSENGWPLTVAAYKVSKAAINAYTRLLARKFGNILVNCVHPGYVITDITSHTGHLTPEEGARAPVMVALLPDNGPSGVYFNQMEISPF
ncbi:hypothetical protein LXL04_026467 [Taraxacum kok-saghyz]